MASPRFNASQVCRIVAGDDGDMDYIFPGSDDDLEMEEMDTEVMDYLDRGGVSEAESDRGGISDAESDRRRVNDAESDRGGVSDAESEGRIVSMDGSIAEGNESEQRVMDRDSEESAEEEDEGGGVRDGGCTLPRGRVRRGSCRGGISRYGVARAERSRSRGRPASRRGRGSSRGRGHGGRIETRESHIQPARMWSASGTDVVVQPFTQPVGPNIAVTGDPTADFLALFTPQLLQHIVNETNRFAALCLSSTHAGSPPIWRTTEDEMKAFIGFAIHMGVQKLPDLYDYWSCSELLHSFPIASRIPRKRFLELRRYLHFVDNSSLAGRGEEGYDRLGKVRPIIDALRQSFLTSYSPHRECSIDEAMVKFKGRSSLKQYLPKKPVKRGFKVWMRADSTNGFVSDLEVYTGKSDTTTQGLGAKVVTKLSSALQGGFYHLYFDNFFSSLSLFDSLLDSGLYACGTFRRDRRGVPEEIKAVKEGKLQHSYSIDVSYCIGQRNTSMLGL